MNTQAAKQIAKQFGVKGFRKMKLARIRYTVGRQCEMIKNGVAFIEAMEAAGYEVTQRETCIQLAQKGLLDSITIKPMGSN